MTEVIQGNPQISQELIEFDNEFYNITKTINILSAVNPTNFDQQKRSFFDSHFSIEPEFTYEGSKLDVFATKRRLLNLPLEKVVDEDLTEIYADTIDSYLDKVDQFNSIGTHDFIYDSLRYFGEPTQKDIGNAKFILHLPGNLNEENEEILAFEEIKKILIEFAENNNLPYNLRVEENMIANALVSGNTIKLNKNARLSVSDTNALAHHEIGVHLVTTLNARQQPLRILEIGNPLNTMTQEGLAILSEYLSDNLTIKRLKILALRVVAVQSMIKEKSFRKSFSLLKEEYGASNDIAFAVCSRIYRGGGFVKDYLYMQGFHKMLNAYENEPNFNLLLAGKTSIDYLPQISRLIDRGILHKPQYVSNIFQNPTSLSEIKQYIAHAIK
nr:flavohemoglobin expression-modulating QEGLA motif protein [uncultured Glaciecola sp.]